MAEPHYPWYTLVNDFSLMQGDIFEGCPVFIPGAELNLAAGTGALDWEKRNIIVMTQSCDLVAGREKIDQALLCAVWTRGQIPEFANDNKAMEDARRGNRPSFHVLQRCELTAMEREIRLVDFRHVHSLPVNVLRQLAASPRLRLLPPYREHLSQAFARFFMRVGLPVDIPSFVKK